MNYNNARKNIFKLSIALAFLIPLIFIATSSFISHEYTRDYDLLYVQNYDEEPIRNMIFEPNAYFNSNKKRLQLGSNIYWLVTQDEDKDIYIGDLISKSANSLKLTVQGEQGSFESSLYDIRPEKKKRDINRSLIIFSLTLFMGYLISRFAPGQFMRYWQ